MSDYLLVTTIQFGSTSCGIGFQTKSAFHSDPLKVKSYFFQAGSTGSQSFPTSLYLKQQNNVSFGYEAHELYKTEVDGAFFENFGQSLYVSEEFDENTIINDVKGENYNGLEICAKFFAALRNYNVYQIRKRLTSLNPSEIKWVLSIPSVRADKAVAFFRKAWQQSCTTQESVTIVTYPDAALTYCLHECRFIQLDRFKKGQRLLVVGFEEEMDSFNVYEKIEAEKFKQLVHFLSGESTRNAILRSFDSFFEDITGSWIWRTSKNIDGNLWTGLCKKVECLVESFKSSNEKTTFSDGLLTLSEVCLEHANVSLKEIIETSEYSSKIRLVGGRLRIDFDLIESLFNKSIMKVIRNIKIVLRKSDDKDVNKLVLIGNVARCGLLFKAVCEAFPEKEVMSPVEAAEAAIKGAVMYGHKPIVVSSIFCGAQCMIPS